MRDYFLSQSRGMFNPRFEVVCTVTLSGNYSVYGGNDSQGLDKGFLSDYKFVAEAIDSATKKGVDFSRFARDGKAPNVSFFYAGRGEATESGTSAKNYIWPHMDDLNRKFNDVYFNSYFVGNEIYTDGSLMGIGVFCHEFGHCLGLPDFYCTVGGSVYGMSNWDIMDKGCYLNNGDTPAGYTSYERHFMGWMDLIDPVENTRYSIAPLNSDEGAAVKVTNDANPDEYYLLEYRSKTGWDSYLPAEGILVLHVDYDKAIWDDNSPNNESAHPRMTIIPADNSLTSYSNYSDTWPYGDANSLTDTSVPAAKVYTGGYINKPITEMAVDNESLIATFWYMRKLTGDVNQDGEINVADVNALIDIILTGKTTDEPGFADVNGDGEITVADVNFLINKILD